MNATDDTEHREITAEPWYARDAAATLTMALWPVAVVVLGLVANTVDRETAPFPIIAVSGFVLWWLPVLIAVVAACFVGGRRPAVACAVGSTVLCAAALLPGLEWLFSR